jgi:hypothetical protein
MLRPFLLGACLLAALTACASTSPAAKNRPETAAATNACLEDTGSRLPPRPGQCAGYGSAYSSEELREAGAGGGNVGRALQNLDPRITIQH